MERRKLSSGQNGHSNGHSPTEGRRDNGQDGPVTRQGKTRLRSLDDLDQRTAATIKAKALVSALEADLGGADHLSTAQRELVKRAALLGAILEDHEVRWLLRQPADLSTYGALVDRQRRLLETLGLGRVAKNVTPPAVDMTERAIELMDAAL